MYLHLLTRSPKDLPHSCTYRSFPNRRCSTYPAHEGCKIFRKSVNLSDYTAPRLCRQQCLLYSAFVISHLPFFEPHNYVRTEEHSPRHPLPFQDDVTFWYLSYSFEHLWLFDCMATWLYECDCLSVCLSEKKRIWMYRVSTYRIIYWQRVEWNTCCVLAVRAKTEPELHLNTQSLPRSKHTPSLL